MLRGTRILGRNRLSRRDQGVLDRGIRALDEGQRDKAGEVDGTWRARKHKARLGDVHVELLFDALAHAVNRNLHGGFVIAWKRREKLLFERARLAPILKPDQAGVRIYQLLTRLIQERDCVWLELRWRERRSRRCFFDDEFARGILRGGGGDVSSEAKKQRKRQEATHASLSQ